MGMRRAVSRLVFVGLVMGLASMAMAADQNVDGDLRVRGHLKVDGSGATINEMSGSLTVFGASDTLRLGAVDVALRINGPSPSISLNDYAGGGLKITTNSNLGAPGSGLTAGIDSRVDLALRGGVGYGPGTILLLDRQGNASVQTGYFQIKVTNGSPPYDDCFTDAQKGRLALDTTYNRLYVCNGERRKWDFIHLKDFPGSNR